MWEVGYSRACFDYFLGVPDVYVEFAGAHIVEPQDGQFDHSVGCDCGHIDCVDDTIGISISFNRSAYVEGREALQSPYKISSLFIELSQTSSRGNQCLQSI